MKIKQILLIISPAIVFVSLWQFIVSGSTRLQFLFSSPRQILETALVELGEASFWFNIYVTSVEAFLGLLAGALLGTTIGLSIWANESIARISKPYIVVIGSIPIFAIAPIMIMWFGTGLLSKVVMSAFAVFFVSLSQAYDGARFCSEEYCSFARTLAASRSRMIWNIIIPGAVRWVSAGIKLSIGLALVGAFIGEFVSSQAGLGHYILKAGSLYDMTRVLLGVTTISIIALISTALVWWLEWWKPHLFTVEHHR